MVLIWKNQRNETNKKKKPGKSKTMKRMSLASEQIILC